MIIVSLPSAFSMIVCETEVKTDCFAEALSDTVGAACAMEGEIAAAAKAAPNSSDFMSFSK